MGSLAIVRPYTPVGFGTRTTNFERLFTPDPKEAIVTHATVSTSVVVDLGAALPVDSMFIGYHNATGAENVILRKVDGLTGGTPTNLGVMPRPLAPLGLGDPNHCFYRAPAPVVGRYWQFVFSAGANVIGVAALGLAVQFQYGTEWGAGRTIEDTGTVERLFGGGFGIDEGTAATGYQWTFGDLQPDELAKLFQIVKERRTTRTVLVVEDPDQTDGLNERLHWGLFQRLQPYERLDPLNTKWAFQIGDWA